jgi:enterochelin esterase-like enzyme
MRKLVIILIVLLTASFIRAQDNARIIEGLSMDSKILNQSVKYSIILPPDYYTSKKSYPVVYLLHGLGDNESSWLEYGQVSQVTDAAVKKREIIPMIYVMPQGFTNYYVNDYAGKFPYEDMFIKELVPFIDKQYRTITDNKHRATLGYSMGGFGALVLPLRNPDIFTVCVPLSISVRTDAQYMTEDASGWDEQWGRLFGAVGTTGESRLTDYYKKHSPFHILAQPDLSKLKDVKIYIDNGDDEETLCRSNEELHMLMRDRNFSHEFRVRNGGHEFQYWRDALPNGLHFISDAFEGKPYRGDGKNLIKATAVSKSVKLIKEDQYEVMLSNEYAQTQRLYPVLYVIGNLDAAAKARAASFISASMESGAFTPVITVFVNNSNDIITEILPAIEKKYRARNGWRFRSLIGYEEGGTAALRSALVPETFTSCVLFDSPIDCDAWKEAIKTNKKKLERMWVLMYTTDKSKNYQSNGCAHTFLRDEWVHHEYRVQEGQGGPDWFINNLKEALDFTQRKIHR